MERLVWMLVLCAVTRASTKQFDSEEAKVYRQLMAQYDEWNPDRNIRPAEDGAAVTVTYGQALQQLLDIDDNNIATFILWENLVWNDAALQWSKESNVSSLRVEPEKIWMPDIQLYNRLDSSPERMFDTQVVVSNDGGILYVPPIIRKVQCVPNDEILKCSQKLGSWVYDGSGIDLQLVDEKISLDYYHTYNDWELVDTAAARNVLQYHCCPEQYIELTIDIYYRKRT